MTTFSYIAVFAILAVITAVIALVPSFRKWAADLASHPLCRPAVAIALMGVAVLIDYRFLFAAPIVFGTVLTEGQHPSEFILSEAPGSLSRDNVTVHVPSRTKYSPGLVLGKVTGTGKYVGVDTDAMTGEQDAAGVLYGVCDNTDGVGAVDFEAVIINRNAEVRGPDMDANGSDEDAVLADLLALGIKVRGDMTGVAT